MKSSRTETPVDLKAHASGFWNMTIIRSGSKALQVFFGYRQTQVAVNQFLPSLSLIRRWLENAALPATFSLRMIVIQREEYHYRTLCIIAPAILAETITHTICNKRL